MAIFYIIILSRENVQKESFMNAIKFLLTEYQPFDDLERTDIERLRGLSKQCGDFIYKYLPGHPCITASALVVDQSFSKILLMHHRDHDFYKQFGGHAEGNSDLPYISEKELEEESKIGAKPLSRNPFDIIVWRMIARTRKSDGLFYPEHDVYDIAFLYSIQDDVNINVNKSEGFDIKWLSLTEFRDMKFDPKNPTFINNPQNVQYNKRIYEKIMLYKKQFEI